ncbi:MAG: GNAT family N-acetyltransferase [Steroidobacteraceae bacterium]
MLTLRPATVDDVPMILALIRELADYEKLLHEVEATEPALQAALFGASPRVFADVAQWNDGRSEAVVGFALWFYTFSTFRGRHGIHLEDLFVRPNHRDRGIGQALLVNLAKRCLRENLGRLEWSVLDWNAPAIAFYKKLGAISHSEWVLQRVTGEALAQLGARDIPALRSRPPQ